MKPKPIIPVRRVRLGEWDGFGPGEVVRFRATTYCLTTRSPKGEWSVIDPKGFRHPHKLKREHVVRGLVWTDKLEPAPLDTLYIVKTVGNELYATSRAELKQLVSEIRATNARLYIVIHRPNSFRTMWIKMRDGRWRAYYKMPQSGWNCPICGMLVEPHPGLEAWSPLTARAHQSCTRKLLND